MQSEFLIMSSTLIRELRSERSSLKAHLLSIIEDSKILQDVKAIMDLPLIANLRNGLWYGPDHWFASTCYFKSTDGHTGQWKFSLTRLNIHVAQIAASNDGCIIVDSTRKGKKFPDSLYSTVPIWMAVLNSIVFPDLPCCRVLELPPWMPVSIRAQILDIIPILLSRVPCDIKDIVSKTLGPIMTSPMRPFWVSPGEDGALEWEGACAESFVDGSLQQLKCREYIPVILLSVSKDVSVESQGTILPFEYIKGAGDDDENWSLGLTPRLFWENKDIILEFEDSSEVLQFIHDSRNKQIEHSPERLLASSDSDLANPILKIDKFNISIKPMTSFTRLYPHRQITHKEKLIFLYHEQEETIPMELKMETDKIIATGLGEVLELYIGSGKRDHPRDYWETILLPQFLHFIESEDCEMTSITFVYPDLQLLLEEASMVLMLAAIFAHRMRNKASVYSSPVVIKDVFKTILLELQMGYAHINPPRRFMKELNIYFSRRLYAAASSSP